jgi:protein TonB
VSASVYLPAPPAAATLTPWWRAVALVAMLHCMALAAIVVLATRPDTDDITGADAVLEIAALVTTAESTESIDQAARDGADQSQTAEIKERMAQRADDMPTEQSSPRPPELDLRMAQQQTLRQTEDPEVEQTSEATEAQPQAMAQAASTASQESLAAPDQTEPVAAAPEEGNAKAAQRKVEAWQRKLFVHIAKFKTYPQTARRAHATGESLLGFSLARDGSVSNITLVRSSGSALLDGAAADVLRRASPMPPLPPELRGAKLDLTLPMRFSLR